MKHQPYNAAFARYLRTGRIAAVPDDATEKKFNPWHDPENGRFTFAGAGRFVGPGSSTGPTSAAFSKPPSGSRKLRVQSVDSVPRRKRDVPKELADPRNAPIHIVKKGESLLSISATRRGLCVKDLAWINGLAPKAELKIGQKLRVPTQAWLDYNRSDILGKIDRIRALDFLLAGSGNKLPIPKSPDDPNFRDIDTAHPPSIVQQIDANLTTVDFNGYKYKVDLLGRVRNVAGEIPLHLRERRSRSAQSNAGGADRLPTDDGGHYIAPRFGGSRAPINHFPQDSGINRGQYRAIEDKWAKARAVGSRVFINITPIYRDMSLRPYEIEVVWFVNGEKYRQKIPNLQRGK